MLTNSHPPGIKNLLLCFVDAEERAYQAETRVRELEARIAAMG